jgi:cytochrome c biogenesis protein CcdA/thiol-disulfide isomerase/thioredoxin
METNLLLMFVAVLAGAFSVLTPCVLVMLPVILAVTGANGRRRVLGVLLGLELSFVGISLLAAAALAALGLPATTQQWVSVAILGVLGLTMLVPALRLRLELATSRAVSRMPGLAGRASGGEGFRGGFAGGLGLGLVWSPCAGPFLAAITAGSVTDGFTTRTVLMSIGFGIGMLGPLLLVLRGGHGMVARLRRRFGARRLDVTMGAATIATAVLIAVGGFTAINRQIAEHVNLTSTPIASVEKAALRKANASDLARVREEHGSPATGAPSKEELALSGYPESDPGVIGHLGPVPKLTGIHHEYNLPAGVTSLDSSYLRGKVVVYDFWTYTCINCIRTLPYLRALNERYAKDGLVIVGVHAPEFAIEKDEGNVHKALRDLDVTWPVATDPELKTWSAFHNHYWPAKYIADRTGELRYVHFGEGGYDQTEAVIRTLLGESASAATSKLPKEQPILGLTPETYVGYGRLNGDQWRGEVAGSTDRIAPDVAAEYELAGGVTAPLGADQFALTGRWKQTEERAVAAGDDSQLLIHYRAKSVYLVLHPPASGAATVIVHDSAGEGGGTRRVRVDRDRLYTLRDGPGAADGTIRLEVPRGMAAYAFTFG